MYQWYKLELTYCLVFVKAGKPQEKYTFWGDVFSALVNAYRYQAFSGKKSINAIVWDWAKAFSSQYSLYCLYTNEIECLISPTTRLIEVTEA